MDRNRFDDMTRAIGGTSTRRRFSGTLAALGLGSIASLSLLGTDEADAKNRGKKNGKKKVTVCHNGQTIQVAKRKLKKHLGHGDTRGECPVVEPQEPQEPQDICAGKECGPDGNGGSCGTCQLPLVCQPNGTCGFLNVFCAGKVCGPDGIGGSCGTCQLPLICAADQSACVPLVIP